MLLWPLVSWIACAPKDPVPSSSPPPLDPAAAMVASIQQLDLRDLGHPVLRWDWEPPLKAPKEAPHLALVLLVEFSDVRFDRFAGDPTQGDKLAAFYQEQLFDEAYARRDTLSHYYATQSGGAYHMDGVVLPPVRLDDPLSAYGGAYRPEGGDWRNDRDPDGLIEAAMGKAERALAGLDAGRFDRWDPKDFDGDGLFEEPDGYVDHLVLVYAGKGQHACQRIRKLDEVLNPNVGTSALDGLSAEQRECADRIWPHRDEVRLRDGQGPTVAGRENRSGGAVLRPDLWVRNYNMQSEYTSSSTFIHEMGHSLGLPDVYAQSSTNSTGPWEVMSHTSDPSPQNLSAWSRLQLGWLRPRVVVPPAFGGASEVVVQLSELASAAPDASRAVLVALPPKRRTLELTTLPPEMGAAALYSGQGNDLDRRATLSLVVPTEAPTLAFDAWWDIEAGWDFAYVELSVDDGRTWTRLRPTDARHMPARHGHDGPESGAGLTGLSGDLDGDGKNESHAGCDPAAALSSGEDRAAAAANPCEAPSWVHPEFDLSAWKGASVQVRWRYFTDGAAVENGLMLDNVTLGGVPVQSFEGDLDPAWVLDGFSSSGGRHELLVPHFYLLEYRDPASKEGYDAGMADGTLAFYWDPAKAAMAAVQVVPRPGVVAWYYDGAFAWSENDPATNGPGKGYLLAVDANPNELLFSGAAPWWQGTEAAFDSHYLLEGDGVQDVLKDGLFRTICFVREPAYVPADLVAAGLPAVCKVEEEAQVQAVAVDGRHARLGTAVGDLLPGDARAPWVPVTELYDFRVKDDSLTARLNDRSLRALHTLDAPFAPVEHPRGVVIYDVVDGRLVEREVRSHPAVARFDDADPSRWQNPNLPFGGVAVPPAGLSWEVASPGAEAPAGTRATVTLRWTEGA